MKLGIVGLPNVGKSTLFNAITNSQVEAANYPFATIEPNVGVVSVPDKRLDVLKDMFNSNKTVPATIEFYDIAGLVKGASEGEGLGNQFLANIREVDAIVHVVRCFDDSNVIHVDGSIDPVRDIETIKTELILSDLEVLEKRRDKLVKAVKGDKKLQPELDLVNMLIENLEDFKPIKNLEFNEEEEKLLKSFNLLSMKKVIYVANVSEDSILDDYNKYVEAVKDYAKEEDSEVVTVSAEIESQISQLEHDEAREFLNDLGLEESGLDKLIKSSYSLLNLISYLTAGEMESRAWTIKKGYKAPQAAGVIHTDFERGFIRAEVVAYDDLIESGSMVKAKEKGLVRSEGKEYVVNDGDVILFRFNV